MTFTMPELGAFEGTVTEEPSAEQIDPTDILNNDVPLPTNDTNWGDDTTGNPTIETLLSGSEDLGFFTPFKSLLKNEDGSLAPLGALIYTIAMNLGSFILFILAGGLIFVILIIALIVMLFSRNKKPSQAPQASATPNTTTTPATTESPRRGSCFLIGCVVFLVIGAILTLVILASTFLPFMPLPLFR